MNIAITKDEFNSIMRTRTAEKIWDAAHAIHDGLKFLKYSGVNSPTLEFVLWGDGSDCNCDGSHHSHDYQWDMTKPVNFGAQDLFQAMKKDRKLSAFQWGEVLEELFQRIEDKSDYRLYLNVREGRHTHPQRVIFAHKEICGTRSDVTDLFVRGDWTRPRLVP